MAGNPLLIRPFGAFEPVRRLSRPTGRAAARAATGSKEESRIIPRRTQVSGTKTVVIGACAPIHPRVGPAVRPDVHPGGPAPVFFWPARAPRRSPDDAVEGHAAIAAPSIH